MIALSKMWLVTGAILAFTSIALGAFGAHGLRDRLSPQAMAWYETASQYQMYHALALLGFGIWLSHKLLISSLPTFWVSTCGWAFLSGTLLFSGSLYIMAFTGIRWLGAITPLGGLGFLLGWALFAYLALRG